MKGTWKRPTLERKVQGRGPGTDTPRSGGGDTPAPAPAEVRRPSAIVVGAGVAGLTAAHELAARGFEVHVVERVPDRRGSPGGPALGGLARSQYSWFLRSSDPSALVEEAEIHAWGTCEDPVVTTETRPRGVSNDSIDPPDDPGPVTRPGGFHGPSPGPVRLSGAQGLRLVWSKGVGSEPGFVPPRRALPLVTVEVDGTDARNVRVIVHVPADGVARLRSAYRYMGWLTRGRAWDPGVFSLRLVRRGRWSAMPHRPDFLDELTDALRRELTSALDTPIDTLGTEVKPLFHAFMKHVRIDIVEGRGGGSGGGTGPDLSYLEIVFPDDVGSCAATVQECAGEHGYRFFPSFYAHVFDTMKRTPILDRDDPEDGGTDADEVRRTIFENLVSLDDFIFALDDGKPPSVMSKSTRQALTEAFGLQRTLLGRLGFESRDLVRLQLRQLAYMTSCDARRSAYETMTWSEFLRLDDGGYSDRFREAMNRWPQVLVGLQADRADARTFGSVATHQLLELVRDVEKRDATLNGPTTMAWFDPWRTYLERVLCVTFHCGEAERLYLRKAKTPGTTSAALGGVRVQFSGPIEYKGADVASKAYLPFQAAGEDPAIGTRDVLPEDAYLVLAVPPNEAYRLLKCLDASVRLALQDPNPPPDLASMHGSSVRDGWLGRTFSVLDGAAEGSFRPMVQAEAREPGSPLQNFMGLQYFFVDRDVPFVRGHLFLPDHPFAISAISQAQFRITRGSARWVPGTLSLDLGDPEGQVGGATLWSMSREQIATESWGYLLRAVGAPQGGAGPNAADTLFHVDEGFIFRDLRDETMPPWWNWAPPLSLGSLYRTPWFLPTDLEVGNGVLDPTAGGVKFNNTPYLVVPPGAFRTWPGTIGPERPQRGYDVEFGNLVCCGTHCRTFTRIGTMESANESARHAVNGILRDFDRGARGWAKDTAGTGPFDLPVTRALNEVSARTGDSRLESAYVPVWPLEEREPKDLGLLKTIDEALHREGLPHLFDILKLDELARDGMPTGKGRPKEANLVDDVVRLVAGGRLDPAHLSRFASPFVLSMLGALLKVPGMPRR